MDTLLSLHTHFEIKIVHHKKHTQALQRRPTNCHVYINGLANILMRECHVMTSSTGSASRRRVLLLLCAFYRQASTRLLDRLDYVKLTFYFLDVL